MTDNSHSEEEHNLPNFEVDQAETDKQNALRERINELADKAKTDGGLTPEETAEREELRAEFLENFRKAFRSQLEMTQIYDDEGNEVTPQKVIDIQKKKGLRD
ncbi:MAG: DUF896 domain-containing protein [Lactobacillaceae bacterium]|jgi:uncharacterized protein YnzC (UPF0291/DUF896 family)|nr:DUF896 domain-containing protein [Lactobacillaceae bacterium]